jgi:hypothetical protein
MKYVISKVWFIWRCAVSSEFDSLIQILNVLDRREKVTVQSLKDLKIADRSTYWYT